MRTPAIPAIAVLALLAGCGSSSSPTTGSTVATSGAPPGNGSSLKVTTTPKYAPVPASTPALSGTVQVAYREITIRPDTLRVKVGTTVKWTNDDPVEHNVTTQSGPQQFASRDFGEGGTYSIKLTHPGVIHYQCTIHPASMNGTIEVVK